MEPGYLTAVAAPCGMSYIHVSQFDDAADQCGRGVTLNTGGAGRYGTTETPKFRPYCC